MKIINLKTYKFSVGKIVVVYKSYQNGILTSVNLSIGDTGKVYKITIESLPEFGLFNLRIVHIKFDKCNIVMNEDIAKEYFIAK